MIKHLYIHVPFCKTICSYCDFVHTLYKEDLVDKWLLRLEKDLNKIAKDQFETIYIGGGTPSSLDTKQLGKLLDLISPFSKKTIEYTVEVNPETTSEDKVKILKNYGVNRISIGLESASDRLLKLMNRHHSFDDVKKAIGLFRKCGIDNISVDILYSLPTQTMDDLCDTLNKVLELSVPHISLYSLTVEKGTIFDKLNYTPLDEDTEADMYELIEKKLKDHNYIHYEIANFAKKGFESRHNLGYWNYDDYLGLSSGATGKVNHQFYYETKDINKYISKDNTVEVESIPFQEEMFENIMMSFRTIYGLDLREFKKRYSVDFQEKFKIAIEKNRSNLKIDNNHCICTNLAILNNILLDFMDYK